MDMEGAHSILVVDDHEDDRALLKQLFESKGYHVLTASNGEIAQEILFEQPVDLVFSDILMPVVDGVQLCRIMKASEQLMYIPIVLYSSIYTHDDDMSQAMSAGAEHYFVKPVEPEKLFSILPEIINRSKQQVNKNKSVVPLASNKDELHRLYSTQLVNRLEQEVENLKREINKRKQLETDLIEEKKLAETTLRSIIGAVITTDSDGNITSMNPVAETMTGWSFKQAQGKDIAECFKVVFTRTGKAISSPVKHVLSTAEKIYTTELITLIGKDNQKYQISYSVAPIKTVDANLLGAVLVFNDMTEEYKLREAAANSEAQVRLLLNSAAEGIYGIDRKGRGTFANKASLKMLGYESDSELIGNKIHNMIHYNNPDNREFPLKNCKTYRAIKEEKETHVDNEVMWRKDGTSFDVEYWSYPVFKGSACVGAVVSFFDITIRKNTDETFRRSQKMEALGKLTGGIAHDYNNMLSVVTGYSELLEKALADKPKLAQYAYEIGRAGDRGAMLTKKLLNFSRKKSPNEECHNLNKLLDDERHMLEKILTARIQLVIDKDNKLWSVWIDEGDFEDALINICINSMHAIEESGTLTIHTKNEKLSDVDAQMLDLKTAGDYVVLRITDTGCGMDALTKEKIFDPFYSTKGDEGTGLGLSQVYAFIQRCNGAVRVYSEPGEGTRFTFYFPRFDSVTDEPKREGVEVATSTKGNETILIVDDEPALLTLITEILSMKGYNVLVAHNGKQALQIVENNSIDLVLSDVIMPEMDGYQLASIIQERYPNIKIQLASGYTSNQNKHMVDEDLHRNLLNKPYHTKDLLKKVRDLLDG